MDLGTGSMDTIQAGASALWALAIAYSLSVVGALLLIIVGYVAAGLVQRLILTGLGRVRGFDATLRHFFATTARYAILILVLVMVLGQFGVQTASIIAAIGAIGLAIGLALQGTLQNIAAGIMLLVLRPFRIGEYVQAGSVAGTVEEIGLFATRLSTADGVYLLAPNSKLWNEPVVNFSRNPRRRNDITIGIGYDDDVELARRAMRELAEDDGRVLGEPVPIAFVAELGDSAVSVTLRYWTASPDYLAAGNDLLAAAKRAFEERGISIPYPHQEVIFRDGVARPATQPETRDQPDLSSSE